MPRLMVLLLLLAVAGLPATASTVYKCSGADGRMTYQDAPCAKAQRQQTLQLSDRTTATSPVASVVPAPASASAAATISRLMLMTSGCSCSKRIPARIAWYNCAFLDNRSLPRSAV